MNGIDGSLGTASSFLTQGQCPQEQNLRIPRVRRRSTACPEILMAIWPICLSPVASLAMWPPLRVLAGRDAPAAPRQSLLLAARAAEANRQGGAGPATAGLDFHSATADPPESFPLDAQTSDANGTGGLRTEAVEPDAGSGDTILSAGEALSGTTNLCHGLAGLDGVALKASDSTNRCAGETPARLIAALAGEASPGKGERPSVGRRPTINATRHSHTATVPRDIANLMNSPPALGFAVLAVSTTVRDAKDSGSELTGHAGKYRPP